MAEQLAVQVNVKNVTQQQQYTATARQALLFDLDYRYERIILKSNFSDGWSIGETVSVY